MRKSMSRLLRNHPLLTRTLVLGYTAFICCFAFPLGGRSLYAVVFWGMVALCLTEAYGPGREKGVFLRLLAAAAAGLLGRYLLEYGEVSSSRNFTAEKILLFLTVFPLGMTAAYHFLTKRPLSRTSRPA